jgi:hypothetical protein
VRGTILRIAELRSQPAYIRVAVRRPTPSRRMVECLFVRRRRRRDDVAAVSPASGSLRFPLTLGPAACQEQTKRHEPLVRRAQKKRKIYPVDRPVHISRALH